MSLINATAIPSGASAYEIEQSLRFNDDDSAYLSRTPSSASNRKTWTWSGWLKRGNLSTYQTIFAVDNGSTEIAECYWDGSDNSIFWHLGGGSNYRFYTNAIYRDSSAWYHIVCSLDTTISSPSGNNTRMKLYVNGEQVTSFRSNSTPSLNYEGLVNLNTQHEIGKRNGTHNPLDGYVAEVHFIDGAAKAPTDFGETGTYGEWKPIEYSGSYGTNGFYLPFKQDYTVEGFSTVIYTGNGATNHYIGGTGFQPDLLWVKKRSASGTSHMINDSVRGAGRTLYGQLNYAESALSTSNITAFNTDGFSLGTGGSVNDNGSTFVGWNWDMGGSYGVQFALAAAGNAKHSTAQKKFGASSILFDGTGDRVSINPSSSTDDYFKFGSGDFTMECWVRFDSVASSRTLIDIRGNHGDYIQLATSGANLYVYGSGVTDFASSASISTNTWYHVALVRFNGTIAIYQDGVNVGQDTTTGDVGGTDYAVNIGMYRKQDGSAEGEALDGYIDEVRISRTARYTAAFTAPTAIFTTDSDTLLLVHSDTTNGSTTFVDDSGAAINTNGSITSNVSANTTYGQSIVSYTGIGDADQAYTIGHGLSSAPEMIIVKARTEAGKSWQVYHEGVDASSPQNYRLKLNATDARETQSTGNSWQNTAPTNSVFTVGNGSWVNENTKAFIAYCFHSVTGYSSIGTYEGTGSSGKKITTGFAPAFVLVKNVDATSQWRIIDTTRDTTDPRELSLFPDSTEVEAPESGIGFTVQSDGFTWQGGHSTSNANGNTHIYMAFADKREYAYWLDQSGNNNDWTSNNLTESDISVDSPTNNFPTIVPAAPLTLKEGNLNVTHRSGTYWDGCHASMGASSGKWYWEIKLNATASTWASAGQRIQAGFVGNPEQWSTVFNNLAVSSQDPAGQTTSSHPAYMISTWDTNFTMYGTDVYSAEGVGIPANNDILNVALDLDNNKAYFGRNGVYYDNDGSTDGNPSTGANPSVDSVISSTYYPGGVIGWGGGDEGELTFNFGQDSSFGGTKTAQGNQDGNDIGDFYYTPPTGFLALCTSNLPAVAVVPSEYFNTVLYTGTGSSNAITGVGFQPDFAWIKDRTNAYQHQAFDAVRGVTKKLHQSTTAAEATDTTSLTAFGADGFTVSTNAGLNTNTANYVAWNWKANGSGSANNNGDNNATVSANTDAKFSIVSYTGSGGEPKTVAHGLGVSPEMVIIKKRNNTGSWVVWHKDLADNYAFEGLDTTGAAVSGGSPISKYVDAVSSTLVTLGDAGENNASGDTYIMYCWASVDGYSKVGSYVGNGNADGTFVYTGFRPAYVMVKRTDGVTHWQIHDTKRSVYNPSGIGLLANTNDSDGISAVYDMDITSNGFKLRATHAGQNASGGTYIYIAFAETPFKYSNAR